jgi:hypothetical protein
MAGRFPLAKVDEWDTSILSYSQFCKSLKSILNDEHGQIKEKYDDEEAICS